MSDDKLKQHRDRFLAFSYASADLFLEIGLDDDILFANGATRSLTGIDEKALLGQKWFSLFAPADRIKISTMKSNSKLVRRVGPIIANLDSSIGGGREAIITGIIMPDHDSFYMTLSFTNDLMKSALKEVTLAEDTRELVDKDTFLRATTEAMGLAKSMGQDLELTLLDIENVSDAKGRIGDELWGKFSESLGHLLNSKSIDGQAAAELKEGRYSLLHSPEMDSNALKEEIANLSRSIDPEGTGFEVQNTSVTADLESISDRELTKAMIYTINEFERKGSNINIESLNSGFKAYVSANAQKIVQFKGMVEQLNFDLHFQPIVNMMNGELSHFEMLTRFKDQSSSTQEWIAFGEDIGMAADFDIAVCERAMNYLLYKSPGRRTKFALNLSGQSIQNEQFFRTLYAKLSLHKELADRIVFEITESNIIDNLDIVNHFIQILQGDGYKVSLDDFGAGAASFQYLHKLPVDYVKIDGSYTRKILTSDRDAIMVKNLVQMCTDLKTGVIAEMIETEEQEKMMKSLGVQYGQGYLYGKAVSKPEYPPKP